MLALPEGAERELAGTLGPHLWAARGVVERFSQCYDSGSVLASFPLNPILPAQDGARAEAFYRDLLGLKQLSPPGADPMAFGAGNGSMIVLSELRDREPPAYPVVSFLVEAIDDLVRGLAERGVEFVVPDAESFGGIEGMREGHVVDFGAVRSTWLRDSEGNLLALNQLAAAP